MKKVAMLIISLLIGLSACKEPDPQYGKEFNPERKKIGLPIIPDNWKLEKVREDYSLWVNPERSEKFNALCANMSDTTELRNLGYNRA